MAAMQAMRLSKPGGLDRLALCELAPARAPGRGEITVALRASSLNFHDYMVVTGVLSTADGRVPLSDGAGEVVAVGEGVIEFVPGDYVVSTFFPDWLDGRLEGDGFRRVPGDGIDGYACTEVTMPVTGFTRAPSGYSHVEAATLTCAGVTAWRALADGNIKPGDTVLVQGTGGVSIFALQFAKAAGATVIATSSSPAKMEVLRTLGADHVLNYRETPDWGNTLRRLTRGGVDHVVEIGGAGTLDQSIAACRASGHIALIGVLAGSVGPVSTVALMAKQIRLHGITVGSRRHQRDMIRAIEANGIRPVIDRTFSLSDLSDAFRYQESGRHIGKIAIEIGVG